MRFPKNNTRNHHCQNTFQDIAEKHQKARLRPEYPKRIRGARIAAPIIPDINAVQSPIQISRLKKAAELLIQGNMKIYEISEACGFSSQSYFWSAFIKQFGMSPSNYAKENK